MNSVGPTYAHIEESVELPCGKVYDYSYDLYCNQWDTCWVSVAHKTTKVREKVVTKSKAIGQKDTEHLPPTALLYALPA